MEVVIISLLVGTICALFVWNIFRIFAVVPDEDRSYLDRPPFGFRLFWPLINTIDYYVGRLFSVRYLDNQRHRLMKAGQAYTLSAEQFNASKIVSAALMLTLLAILILSTNRPQLWSLAIVVVVLGFFYPDLWLKEAQTKRDRCINKDLPFYLDIIVLAVESGTNFTGGLTQAVQKAPDGPLRFEFGRVLRDIRAGKPRSDALRDLTTRVGGSGIKHVVSGIIQAEKMGSSLGAILRIQAENLRSERFLRAEKAANEAPVKLLGPLIMFIFPNTFLVIIFVMLSQALAAGVLQIPWLLWAYQFPNAGAG